VLNIRRAGLSDVASLATLRFQWRVSERGERGLDEASYETELARWTREHENSHVAFLALDEDRPLAMAWLAIVERIPGPEFFVRRSAYVQSVYVVPEIRSQGVGTALMNALLAAAREMGLDYLAVHPSTASFNFYRRLGFEESTRVLELR
jgi:GNAT superfamily N-acetyltransferase